MLTFKHSAVLYLAAMAVTAVMDVFLVVPLLLYIGITIIFIGVLAFGAFHIDSQFYLPVFTASGIDQRAVAITFDDGPVRDTTPILLELLEEFNAEAAFFVLGREAAANETIIRQIDGAHHLIGNHTYSHSPFFNFLSVKRTVEELRSCEIAVFDIIGKRMRCFRPPFGVTNPTLRRAVNTLDYTVIGWSIRSLDTLFKSDAAIMQRITKRIKPGAVLLLHETTPDIAGILRMLLVYLKEQQYAVVRVDTLLGLGAYR